MTRKPSAWAATALAAIVVAGCVGVRPSSTPALPSAIVAPSRTLNPNELDRLGITPTPFPTPTRTAPPTPGSPTPRPSPTPAAPDLEALLPTTLLGTTYIRQSVRFDIATDVRGGDVCSVFCPGELGDLARAAHVRGGFADLAVAVPATQTQPLAYLVAVRIHGARATDLVAGWIKTRRTKPYTETLRAGGKRVTLVVDSYLPSAGNVRYLYGRGDVLFMVLANPVADDPSQPDGVVVEAFRALP